MAKTRFSKEHKNIILLSNKRRSSGAALALGVQEKIIIRRDPKRIVFRRDSW